MYFFPAFEAQKLSENKIKVGEEKEVKNKFYFFESWEGVNLIWLDEWLVTEEDPRLWQGTHNLGNSEYAQR